ncbi:ACP S-malonyltransferase [Caballeronia sp. DA-9]|uniref:ACP S-malonyltransferase n=1 Tax=Caballeronia sp. DA-9 TaxID=3436237 RepID=UPI003F66F349
MFDVFRTAPRGRAVIDEASHHMDVDLWHADRDAAGTKLFTNAYAQPLICAAALAAWRALSDGLPEPAVCAGYSIGELAAYGCAGALTVGETIDLARARAALMDNCEGARGGMLAVRGIREPDVEDLCDRFGSHIAIENASDHFIIGGAEGSLEQIAEHASRAGANTVRRLPVSIISHTPLLAPAAREFKAQLRNVDAGGLAFPVLAGINGAAIHDWSAAVDTLAAQLEQTIRWSTCMEAAIERGATVFLEMGPGASLVRMLQEAHPEVHARSLSDFRSIDGALRWVERAMG